MINKHPPFARAKAMLAVIRDIMTLGLVDQRVSLARLGEYKSHGHGEGLTHNKHSRHRVAMDKRAAKKASNVKRARRASR